MIKILIYILIIFAISTNTVVAMENAFTIYPTHPKENSKWIIKDVNPNQNYDEYLTVENLSEKEINLEIVFHKTTGNEENITIIEDSNSQNTETWIMPEIKEVTLAPFEKKNIKININIPSDVINGKYQGAVMATYKPTNKEGMQITTRIGNRIYLNVTNNKELQSNTFVPPNNNLHIFLMGIGLAGIIYGNMSRKLTTQK